MSPRVTRQPVQFGRIQGTLFLPETGLANPCVVSLYGGINKGRVIEERSALFASRGFASLALAFFGPFEGLPKDYLNLGTESRLFSDF